MKYNTTYDKIIQPILQYKLEQSLMMAKIRQEAYSIMNKAREYVANQKY